MIGRGYRRGRAPLNGPSSGGGRRSVKDEGIKFSQEGLGSSDLKGLNESCLSWLMTPHFYLWKLKTLV